MKTRLLLLVTLCFCLAAVAPAQDLIIKSPAVARAEQVAKDTQNTIVFLEMRLRSFYRNATVKGEEQAFLDAFGDKAAQAVTWYKATRELVLSIKPTADIPPVDETVFIVKANGTVQFVPPPAPPVENPPSP